ncbi:MAG: twin-arginine translocase TatA/TatE family subunit [Chlorobiales bacterium]|jgi:sec-independent protein translocase protein TatA|nr:twin-arginine translocase TatA/TatE family subunit [Chlorobiales bacterium]
MFGIGGQELMLILVIILVLFGAKKLPELARGLGKGIKEFKNAQNESEDEIDNTADKTPKK